MSYKDAPVLTAWDANLIRSSVKSWIIFLAGEANFTLGIDDFSFGAMQLELGRPISFSAITPATQSETHGHRNEGVFVNGYRGFGRPYPKSRIEAVCDFWGLNDTQRLTFSRLISCAKVATNFEDMLLVLDGRAQKYFGEPTDTALKTLINHFLTAEYYSNSIRSNTRPAFLAASSS